MKTVTEIRNAETGSGTQEQVSRTQEPKIPNLSNKYEALSFAKSLEEIAQIARGDIPLAPLEIATRCALQ